MPLSQPDRRILQDALAASPQFSSSAARHAIVHDALAGYAESDRIGKALQWVNWEGPSPVFASALLSALDGREAAPGISALGELTQVIESMSGPVHRQKLADLRTRHGWDAVVEESSLDVEVVRERIHGEDTLKPMYYLRRALAAADAVVRVDLQGSPQGTGFLVAPNLMITNHHVIATQEQARVAQACFFVEARDEANKSELRRKPVTVNAAPGEPLLYTSDEKHLDISLIRLQDSPPLARYLPLRRVVVKPKDRVVIIQHPRGIPKQISLQNNRVAAADARIVQYYTATQNGSSGSPVLDSDFAVVAVHHTGAQDHNEGTSVIALLADLPAALQSELTILEN